MQKAEGKKRASLSNLQSPPKPISGAASIAGQSATIEHGKKALLGHEAAS